MRIPVAGDVSTKDGLSNKNARLTNVLAEPKGEKTIAAVRPGVVNIATTSGSGNGLVCFNDNLVSIWDATLGTSVIAEPTWEEIVTGGGQIGTSIYANSIHLALGNNNGYYISTDNGENWTSGTIGVGTFYPVDVAWNGAVFCGVGGGLNGTNQCCVSSNGTSWSAGTLPSSAYWESIAWNGSVFCAIIRSTTTNVCATSSDGVSWTARTLPETQWWYSITWDGSVFCASSFGTKFATSADGITWASKTVPVSGAWWGIAGNAGTLIACASNTSGVGLISQDSGATWDDFIFPTDASWRRVRYFDGKFYVVGYSTKKIQYSADGITWDEYEIPGVVDGNINLADVSGNSNSLVIAGSGAKYDLGIRRSGITFHGTTIDDDKYDFALMP